MKELTPKCITVTNYIISQINKYNEGKLFKEQIILTAKKINKLLYFCDIEYMKINNGKPLFTDDFNAWPSGPAIDEIYDSYMLHYFEDKIRPIYLDKEIKLTKFEKLIIDEVLDATKEMDTSDLVKISQIENGPWSKVYNENEPNLLPLIPKKETFDFYSKIDLFNSERDFKNDVFRTDEEQKEYIEVSLDKKLPNNNKVKKLIKKLIKK